MPSLTAVAERPRTPQRKDISRVSKLPDNSGERNMIEELDLKIFPPLKRFKILEKARRVENERLIQLQHGVGESVKMDVDGVERCGADEAVENYFYSLCKRTRREISLEDERTELLFRRMLQKEGFNAEEHSDIETALGLPNRSLAKREKVVQEEHEETIHKMFSKVSGKRSGITNRIHAPGIPEGECSKEVLPQVSDSEDDGIICDVCRSSDGEPADPIVFCDGCDLTVHASCYGDPLCKKVPEGDWFCERCKFKNVRMQTCCLCISSKGAMKQTTDKKWAHISCALFVPEVFFRSAEAREPIDCSQIPERRWQMVCSICKRNGGACVECTETACAHTFHVTCGLERELALEFREGKTGSVVLAFCESHTPRWEKQQHSKERGRYKIVPREPLPTKRKAPTKWLTRCKRDIIQ